MPIRRVRSGKAREAEYWKITIPCGFAQLHERVNSIVVDLCRPQILTMFLRGFIQYNVVSRAFRRAHRVQRFEVFALVGLF